MSNPSVETNDRRPSPDCGARIVLATVNARYVHAAFGLRWLLANLGPLRDDAEIREFTLAQDPGEIAEALLARNPEIVGLGVYVWNVEIVTRVVQILKGVRPGIVLVLGGPEASHEYEGTALFASVDYLIRGEGERAFAALARAVLDGERPAEKVITAAPPDLTELVLPYDAYTDEDLAKRLTYVEASRGCPFGCEFCLSSLDKRVREFPLDSFLDAMARLIERGGRRFKFVDRTFNLNEDRFAAIVDFFAARWREGMQVHFEILPDRLTDRMMRSAADFPAGGLRLEAGVQSFNADVLERIGRRQDLVKTEENLRFLCHETGAVVHVDLIAGLPGESIASFAAGFDRLLALGPAEIQVGILKRLKGAPIGRHTSEYAMVYSDAPPYEILQNNLLTFEQVQRVKRFARYFEAYYNSGNFPRTLPLLWTTRPSAFDAFMAFSDVLWKTTGRTYQLPLVELVRYLYEYLADAGAGDRIAIAQCVEEDFRRLPGRKDNLEFLRGARNSTT